MQEVNFMQEQDYFDTPHILAYLTFSFLLSFLFAASEIVFLSYYFSMLSIQFVEFNIDRVYDR